jgi:glycerol uptake facilitator-like aquaporin
MITGVRSLYKPSLFVEALGTFMFVLTIGLAAHNAGVMAPLAIGLMLSTLVFAFGYISGGHFNPAVTVGVMIVKAIDWKKGLMYIVCQMLGGIGGALFSLALTENVTGFPAPEPNPNGADHGKFAIKAILAEFIFTFILVSVVLNVACSRQKDNNFYGIAIGFTVSSAAWAVGGISGGGFNPAVSFPLQLVKCLFGNCEAFAWFWLYLAAPIGGAVLSAILFKFCSLEENIAQQVPEVVTVQGPACTDGQQLE